MEQPDVGHGIPVSRLEPARTLAPIARPRDGPERLFGRYRRPRPDEPAAADAIHAELADGRVLVGVEAVAIA